MYSNNNVVLFFFFLQVVNQDLLATPLVPPQLTIKDFYMTGGLIIILIQYKTNDLNINDKC